MSLRLKRGIGTLVAATLAAGMLALFPAVAEAQAEDKNTPSVVVRPGDSLWSISEERLGPNATPQRIVEGTAQIYALNRGRIGADPNLIRVGQKILVPPAMSEQPAGVTPARKTAEAAEASPRDRRTKAATTVEAPKAAPREAGTKVGEASKTVPEREAEQASLPDEAAAPPVPTVRELASNDSPNTQVASFMRTVRTEFASAASTLAESLFTASADTGTERRRLLGLGVLVLTLAITALVAWKLPMRRTTRRDAELWGMSSGYYGETPAAYRITSFVYHPGSLGDRNEHDARREAPGALGHGRRLVLTGSGDFSAPIGVRKAKAVPRNALALGAHSPKVRRTPRRAHATRRARKLRPRGGASRRPGFLVVVRQTGR